MEKRVSYVNPGYKKLFELPNETVVARKTRKQKFDDFNANNPEVYEKLRDLAFEVLERGRSHIGFRLLWERVRWDYEMDIEREEDDVFKLWDGYTPYYARMLMDREPRLKGMFTTRDSKAQKALRKNLAKRVYVE